MKISRKQLKRIIREEVSRTGHVGAADEYNPEMDELTAQLVQVRQHLDKIQRRANEGEWELVSQEASSVKNLVDKLEATLNP